LLECAVDYFSSQEIDSHHATEHRSTDQSRNGCRTRGSLAGAASALRTAKSERAAAGYCTARFRPDLCRLRVKNNVLTVNRSHPVYPDQRTFLGTVGRSQRYQERACLILSKNAITDGVAFSLELVAVTARRRNAPASSTRSAPSCWNAGSRCARVLASRARNCPPGRKRSPRNIRKERSRSVFGARKY
jgi:hypothetical protein